MNEREAIEDIRLNIQPSVGGISLEMAILALERVELIKQGKGCYARTDGPEGIITIWEER